MKTRYEVRQFALQDATKIAIARQAQSAFAMEASASDVVEAAEEFEKFLLREGASAEAEPGAP